MQCPITTTNAQNIDPFPEELLGNLRDFLSTLGFPDDPRVSDDPFQISFYSGIGPVHSGIGIINYTYF